MTTAREGQAEVNREMNHPLILGSDHRPVMGEITCKKEEWTKSGHKHIRRDWKPETEKDMEDYRDRMTARMEKGCSVHDMDTILHEEATATKHTTEGERRDQRERESKEGKRHLKGN